MIANLSVIFAQWGRCSLTNVPGTAVATGSNGPRISAGASGLRSHMSIVLGPPPRNRKMTDVALAGWSAAA